MVDIILADEPTGALDSHAARQLLGTLAMLCREYGATILMVTHETLNRWANAFFGNLFNCQSKRNIFIDSQSFKQIVFLENKA